MWSSPEGVPGGAGRGLDSLEDMVAPHRSRRTEVLLIYYVDPLLSDWCVLHPARHADRASLGPFGSKEELIRV